VVLQLAYAERIGGNGLRSRRSASKCGNYSSATVVFDTVVLLNVTIGIDASQKMLV
jgi:hypothetical protein